MNYDYLFQQQQELDAHITDRHDLEGHDLTENKILAALVEVGELANETRVFKHWSIKPASPREVILDELADVMHFLLSLGNEKPEYKRYINDKQLRLKAPDPEKTTAELFIDLYESIINFKRAKGCTSYAGIWVCLYALAARLQYSENDMLGAYMHKNKINHIRQETGY